MPGILLVCPAKRRKRYALINKSGMGTATLCNYQIAHIDSRGIETALLAFMASRSMLIRRSVCILPRSLPPSAFRLQGGHAIRWYEMCQAKKHLGTFTMSVEELRAWREIEEHALPSVKNLRKRAIDVSKAELDKKADLTFTYKPTKTGRRITGWTFKVKKNQPRPVQRQLPQRDHEPDHTPEVKAKGLAALAVCKREVAETAPPVARITRGSRV